MALQCFQFGAWFVNPAKQSLHDGKQERHLEPRAMDVLVALCRRPHVVISADELLEQCWPTSLYGDNPVHKVIARLRRELGDDPVAPTYIETIRKRGYRTCAEVRLLPGGNSSHSLFLNESPFCGLLPFDERHAPVFFGRNDAIFRLRQLIATQIACPQPVEMVLLLGASGSGKTSLVRAGLLPSLAQPGALKDCPLQLLDHASVDLAEKGERSLLLILQTMLNQLKLLRAVTVEEYEPEVAAWARRLIKIPTSVLIVPVKAELAAGGESGHDELVEKTSCRHLLFIDRFEALFDERSVQEQERNLFLRVLDTLARTRCVFVLLACRNDFYPQIAANPLLMECKLRGAHFDLAPPSQSELAQMIRLPAQAANLRYEVNQQSNLGLDDILCESAVGNPDALPLLQYTLHELYRMKSKDGEMGFAAYDLLGGIEGAIGQRAEQLVRRLSTCQANCLPRIWSLVVTLSSQQPEIRSRHASWSALRNTDEREVVQALVESRLFVSEFSDGVAGFGVAHEALLRRWPRLMAWIDSHQQALQTRARIGEQAQRWEIEARNSDLLLPQGRQLEAALALAALSTFSLSTLEQAFIAASQSRGTWRKRLRLCALATMSLLSLLIFMLGLSALQDQRRANEQRATGEALATYMLGEFTDKLRPIGRLDLLDSMGAKALDYFSTSSDQDLNPAALTQRAKALQVLAEVRIERHDTKAALDALQSSDAIFAKLQMQTGLTRAILSTMGGNARLRGQIASSRDDWPGANAYFQQYLSLARQQLKLLPSDREGLMAQSDAHLHLGMVAIYQRHFILADQAFEESIRNTRLLMDGDRGGRLQKAGLADAYSWSGFSKEQQGQLKAAMDFYEKEVTIVRQLHSENPSEILWASRWALALQNQVQLNLALGNDETALAISRQSEQIFQMVLARDSSNNARMLEMIMIQMRTQRILARSGTPVETMLALQGLQQVTQKMMQSPGSRRAWERVDAQLQLRIGVCLMQLQQWAQGRQKIQDAQERLEGMLVTTPANFQARVTLLEALLARSELEESSGNRDLARQSCERGLVLARDLAQSAVEYRVLDPWLKLNLCLQRWEVVRQVKQQLDAIGYRDSVLLRQLAASEVAGFQK